MYFIFRRRGLASSPQQEDSNEKRVLRDCGEGTLQGGQRNGVEIEDGKREQVEKKPTQDRSHHLMQDF